MTDALGSPQSVLVLGGGSDIGLAITRRLVARRARTVVLGGRHPESLKTHADELRDLGAETVHVVPFDATETDSHEGFVNEVFDTHGDFDLVLLAFGVLGDQSEAERDPSAAVEILQTNFVGAVSVALPVAARLRSRLLRRSPLPGRARRSLKTQQHAHLDRYLAIRCASRFDRPASLDAGGQN